MFKLITILSLCSSLFLYIYVDYVEPEFPDADQGTGSRNYQEVNLDNHRR